MFIFLEDIMKRFLNYFTAFEKLLWCASVLMITVSFIIFDRSNFLTLAASIIGVTSLIFIAKGNPIGQIMMIIFSLFYGWISFSYAYYGEIFTYLAMTLPMAAMTLVSWLKHPYEGKKSEVEVSSLSKGKKIIMVILTVVVTAAFYFILKYFNTANLIPSTISVTTSFVAAYLTFCRSPYYALAYACNDIVLIVLWVMASINEPKYISVVVCFIAFLFNDLYGFFNWNKMKRRQTVNTEIKNNLY